MSEPGACERLASAIEDMEFCVRGGRQLTLTPGRMGDLLDELNRLSEELWREKTARKLAESRAGGATRRNAKMVFIDDFANWKPLPVDRFGYFGPFFGTEDEKKSPGPVGGIPHKPTMSTAELIATIQGKAAGRVYVCKNCRRPANAPGGSGVIGKCPKCGGQWWEEAAR